MSHTLLPLLQQIVLVLAAIVLFTSFVLLSQARLIAAIHVFAWQGTLVAAVTTVVAATGGTCLTGLLCQLLRDTTEKF